MMTMTFPFVTTTANREALRRLTLSAMFLAIGIILPFFTGQIQQIGKMLLPMHIPVMLCGLVCGWGYGATVGAILPIMRSLMFGMPLFYPEAMSMAVELAVYGFAIGAVYALLRRRNLLAVYIALFVAMLAGRMAWGGAEVLFLGLQGGSFTWNAFVLGAFLNAIPGIILQLLLIPGIMSMLHVTGLERFRGKEPHHD